MKFKKPLPTNTFIEPSYVFAPYVPMQESTIFFRERRGWYVRAKLKHFEPGRETWEFSLGDLVRHISSDDTVGTIVGTKFEEVGGLYNIKERYEMYDVVWAEHGPSTIEMTEIKAQTRKLRARWTAEVADDSAVFRGIDPGIEIK